MGAVAMKAKSDSTVEPGPLPSEEPLRLSIVVPVYCESATICELHRRVATTLDHAEIPFELIFVDDGSTDDSVLVIEKLVAEDARVRAICLSRNFGLQAAVTAGLDHAHGAAVVIMDGDLQDPPELIPELVARWRAGYDVVYTTKLSRVETGVRKWALDTFYRVYNRLSDTRIVPGAGLFSLMDQRVVATLRRFHEQHRFITGMRTWVGFRQCELPFHRSGRFDAGPRQSVRKLFEMAFDGVFAFSTLPLRLATFVGLAVSLGSFVAVLAIVLLRLFATLAIPGWASLLSAVFFMGGVQLVFFGVLGEYVARIYGEVKARPFYVVAQELGSRALDRTPASGS
jgi:polyisoprenyl-phosphate glycosyltransferase